MKTKKLSIQNVQALAKAKTLTATWRAQTERGWTPL